MKRTNMRHRALAIFLLLAMLLTALPLSAWAEELNGEQIFGAGGGYATDTRERGRDAGAV